MPENEKTFEVTVGRPKKGVKVTLCAAGHAKLIAHAAKLQYRKAEGTTRSQISSSRHVKRNPYIFVRYRALVAGSETRPELGRWLLDSEKIPVVHLNGNPLDFRIENLQARESDRQRARRERAASKRNEREKRSAAWAAKRALRPPPIPDGLTPDQKLMAILDDKFQEKLRRRAGAIIGDPGRAENVVHEVVLGSVARIKSGEVENARGYLWQSVKIQALKERDRMWCGQGDERRPKAELRTLSDTEV